MHIIRCYMLKIGACIIYFVVYVTILAFKSHMSTFQVVRNRPSEHPDQVPGGHPIFHRGIEINSKTSVEMYNKNEIHRGQLIFRRGAQQKLCLKNVEVP